MMTEDPYRKSISACADVALGVATVQSIVSVCMVAALVLVCWIPIVGYLWLSATLFIAGCTWFWWREFFRKTEELRQLDEGR